MQGQDITSALNYYYKYAGYTERMEVIHTYVEFIELEVNGKEKTIEMYTRKFYDYKYDITAWHIFSASKKLIHMVVKAIRRRIKRMEDSSQVKLMYSYKTILVQLANYKQNKDFERFMDKVSSYI